MRILIVIFFVAILLLLVYILLNKQKRKTIIEDLFDEMSRTHFPGGAQQIEKEAEEIFKLSNDKLNFDQAKDLLLKSKAILTLNPSRIYDHIEKNWGNKLGEKELKSIVGYIMFHSSGGEIDNLVSIGFGLNDTGYSEDEIPVGYGEFGRCLTNPIPIKGITANNVYLEKLRTTDNRKVMWNRIGSHKSEVKEIPGLIDVYEIFSENKEDLGKLYISPYNKKISNKAPRGFIIINKF